MDAAERALLEDAVGAAFGAAGADADAQLAALGWLEMLGAEPRDAIAVVFEGLGTANRAATVLDDVLVSALDLEPSADLAVLLPPFATWAPPGVVTDGHARAAGMATARVATARELVVVCNAGPELRAVVVPTAAIEARPVRGVDPGAGFHTVTMAPVAAAGDALDATAWDASVARGRRAVAHQMLGESRTMLALARAHALERVQFGRSIGSFQAVRHRLAEALVAIEALAATLGAAADEPNELTAALAKATAGRSAQTVATHCQQVLAGIGFTTDHPFHRSLKRTMLLEGVLGTADAIAVHLGRQLLADRRVPTLIEL
jgi:alkylation response protein AidB-like acyl-CoA dehydrogenase